uniref:Uncharacterized protein n=1 Tax=Vitis vinifera TaxID=29760 RepID=F6HCM5_VITVI
MPIAAAALSLNSLSLITPLSFVPFSHHPLASYLVMYEEFHACMAIHRTPSYPPCLIPQTRHHLACSSFIPYLPLHAPPHSLTTKEVTWRNIDDGMPVLLSGVIESLTFCRDNSLYSLKKKGTEKLRSAANVWHDEFAPLPKPQLGVNIERPASHCRYDEDFAKQLSACLHGALVSCDSVGMSFSKRTPEKVSNVVVKEHIDDPKVHIRDGAEPSPHMKYQA